MKRTSPFFTGMHLHMLVSVTTNTGGLQTAIAIHVGQNSSAHVACIVGLRTDAVVVTETGFKVN